MEFLYALAELVFYCSGAAIVWELLKIYRIVKGDPDARRHTLSGSRTNWERAFDGAGSVHAMEDRKAHHDTGRKD